MEDFLLFLLVLSVIVLFILQRGRSADRAQLRALSDHIDSLESRLQTLQRAATPEPPPAPTPQPPPPPATVHHAIPNLPLKIPAPPPPPPKPAFIPPPPPTPKPSISLEERLGQNWLSKLGIILLVIGLALFLGRELITLGPAGKSSIGLALSLLILASGVLLERRDNYRIFARASIGGGWALTFFVTFALYHVPAMQVLHSQAIDLILMLIVAAAMVAHSLRYKSQVVTSLAFLLAFVTVGISELTLFSLVAGALLAVSLIFIAFRERWFALALAGLIGVYLNHFLWLHRLLPEGAIPHHPFPSFIPSAALLLLYWLLFRLLYIFRLPLPGAKGLREQQFITNLTAILNSVGLLSLLKYQSAHPEWAFYGLLALGTAELALAFLARRRNHTAFVILTILASTLLVAAVPVRYTGANWSLLWLFEAEALFLAGIALRELVFRRLGTLAAFATTVQIFLTGVAPIFDLRKATYSTSHTDLSHHLSVTIALVCAAIVFWLNAEILPSRFAGLTRHELDSTTLTATSYLAALSAATALWICLPSAWVVIGWLILTLALSFAADKLNSRTLATQADLLALAAIARTFIVNLQLEPAHPAHFSFSLRTITVALAAILLYLHMLRRTRAHGLTAEDYIPASYAWAAALLLSLLLWYELKPANLALGWSILALVLLELGINLRKTYLRHQACTLFAASFIALCANNLHLTHAPNLYTTLPVIALYFWVYERLRSRATTGFDRIASTAAAWCASIAVAALLYVELSTPWSATSPYASWIAISWAALALLAIAAAWALKRRLFLAQALVLLIAAALRALAFNLYPPTPITFTTGRLFTVSATSAVMLLALPFAFAIRRYHRAKAADPLAPEPTLQSILFGRPEQPFFFVPLVLITVLLAVQLRAGMITIAWSALGLMTFLFALAVAERSFRLAGLSLLMLCVGKILCIDIWQATPTDRYITLIVLGIALLAVSFLYSRYRETILKLL
jgi:hypothetical protein